MRSRVDYDTLEHEYIAGDMSIRELARQHEIRSWSSVNDQARKREWVRKREAYRTRRDEKFVEKAADHDAGEAAEIRTQSIAILRGMLARYAQRLAAEKAEDRPVIQTREAIAVVKELMALTGQATEITETRNFGLNISTELPPELAAALLQLARERRSDPFGRGVGAALPALVAGIGDE